MLVDGALARPGHVVDPLEEFTGAVPPAFDDRDAVQIGTVGVFHGAHQELQRSPRLAAGEIAAHRNTVAVADRGQIPACGVGFRVVPAPEEPKWRRGCGTMSNVPRALP